MAKQYHVAANLQQDFTDAEKQQARTNIGAIDIEPVNEVRDYANDLSEALENTKQDKLTAGHGITISGNTVNAALYVNKATPSIPPVITEHNDLTFFTDGRVTLDNSDIGVMAPVPVQADSGKVLVARWTGSPSIGTAYWSTLNFPKTVQTTSHANVGSPSDTPYNLFTYDGLAFYFRAGISACSLLVQSSEVSAISGIVEHLSDSGQVTDGKSLFNNEAIASNYILYTMSQYEIASTVKEVLKIKLWYTKGVEPKSLSMDVLKTGQVDLDIRLIGG